MSREQFIAEYERQLDMFCSRRTELESFSYRERKHDLDIEHRIAVIDDITIFINIHNKYIILARFVIIIN